MISSASRSSYKVRDITGSPGQKITFKGTKRACYFGELSGVELNITNLTNFRNHCIGAVGDAHTATNLWLKFCYKGHVEFVSKTNIFRRVSWNNIYSGGAVYPITTGTGIVPGRGGIEPGAVTQNKTYVADDITFDVRLLEASDNDPETNNQEPSGAFTFPTPWLSEFGLLLGNVSNATGKWANLSDEDLTIGGAWSTQGNASWCQNSTGVVQSGWNWVGVSGPTRALRGFGSRPVPAVFSPDLSTGNMTRYVGPNGPPGTGGANVTRDFYSWRPVLEVYQISGIVKDKHIN